MINRFEQLEQSFLQKEEEILVELNLFVVSEIQLAKTFRRDVEELKKMQQEHLTKLENNSMKTSFDDLIERQIEKFYHFKPSDFDDEEEEEDFLDDENQRVRNYFEKFHDEHLNWMKKKKKATKSKGAALERIRKNFTKKFFDLFSTHFFFTF